MQTQLTNDLCLAQVTAPGATPVLKRESMNRILVEDVSGSTAPFVVQMGEDLCDKVDQLPDGDFLTYAIFSSAGGNYRIVLKGVEISPKTRTAIKQSIRDNSRATNLTCFSEVITEIAQIVPDLAVFSKRFSLVFTTDGCPVPDNNNERHAIETAIKKVAGLLTSVLVVGYGDYYNRELLIKMTTWFGGVMIHSSSMKDWSMDVGTFLANSDAVSPKVKVHLPGHPRYAFSISGVGVSSLDIEHGDQVLAPKGDAIYAILGDPLTAHTEQVEIDGFPVEAVYAAALVLSQNMQGDDAQEIISKLGDVRIARAMSNAFTAEEIGQSEVLLSEAVAEPEARFMSGRQTGVLPDPNAFCLLDLLDWLTEQNVKFLPGHPDFKYKLIGRPPVYEEGYPKFVKDRSAQVALTSMAWNESRLNLNLSNLYIPGHIQLRADHEAFGFGPTYPTFQWKTYTIVRDGLLNVVDLPVVLDADQIEFLKDKLTISLHVAPDGQVLASTLHLDSLPLVNKAIVNQIPPAKQLAAWTAENLTRSAEAKVWRSLISKLEPEKKDDLGPGLTADQQEYLKAHGITARGFQPPMKPAEATDHYDAFEFEIAVEGFSSLPSLNDVEKRHKEGKKQTKGGELMLKTYAHAMDLAAMGTEEEFLAACKKKLSSLTKEIRIRSSLIQRVKFGVVIGKLWFPDFPTRQDENKLDYQGYTLNFRFKSIQVAI